MEKFVKHLDNWQVQDLKCHSLSVKKVARHCATTFHSWARIKLLNCPHMNEESNMLNFYHKHVLCTC